MAIRIHHTQVKQAAKLGIELTKSDMDVTASRGGQSASAPSAGLAIAALLRKLGTSTADVMRTLKPKAAKKPGAGKARKSKFKCEGCGSARKPVKDDDGELVCAECGEAADGGDEGKSVVKRKYKNLYRPHRMSNGDALNKQIRTEFMTKRDPDTKKFKIDWPRFVQFAKINDCWTDTYKALNHGLARMSVVNRLRAKIRNKVEVKWH